MDKQQVFAGIKVLVGMQLNFGPDLSSQEKTELYLEVWNMYLSNYKFEQFRNAIYLWGKSNSNFPRPADIIKHIPVSNKYIQPERVFSYYIATPHTELLETENGNIILDAVKQAGYTRYDLKNVSNRDTLERFIKPKIEKKYKRLIEEDQTKGDLLAISNQQMKLEHKEN